MPIKTTEATASYLQAEVSTISTEGKKILYITILSLTLKKTRENARKQENERDILNSVLQNSKNSGAIWRDFAERCNTS